MLITDSTAVDDGGCILLEQTSRCLERALSHITKPKMVDFASSSVITVYQKGALVYSPAIVLSEEVVFIWNPCKTLPAKVSA